MPTVPVGGNGIVTEPVPPVAVVYHNKFVPVAERPVAKDPWHKLIGEVAIGAAGGVITFTIICALGLSHPLTVWLT